MKTKEALGGQENSRQHRRVKTTRRKILNAARKTFAEKGLDLSTIDDITERADVGKGTFYYHFPDKNAVISELINEMMGELVNVIEKKCEGISDLQTLLNTIIAVHIDFFSNRWEDFVLYFLGTADLTLKHGYSGIEPPFLRYLESMENQIDAVVKFRLSDELLRRFGCAVAGFLSGYYSFSAILSLEEDDSFKEMRGAFVAALAKFISASIPVSD